MMRWIAVVAVMTLGACATVQPPQSLHLQAADAGVRDCAQWFQALDAAVDAAGVRDREAAPVAGFAYLRSTRFLAALMPAAQTDALRRTWLEQLRVTDLQARAAELRNLPAAQAIANAPAMAQRCGAMLMAQDLAHPALPALLAERVNVADAYSDGMRIAGLYGLTRIPFANGVAQWHAEAKAMFERSRSGAESAHPVERYAPANTTRYNRAEVASLLGWEVRERAFTPADDSYAQKCIAAMFAYYNVHGLQGSSLALKALLDREPTHAVSALKRR